MIEITDDSSFNYHVIDGRLLMMNDNQILEAYKNRVTFLIKKKLGVNDINNKCELLVLGPDYNISTLEVEDLIGIALELGITVDELGEDNSMFHVISPDKNIHTFCIHDFETNQRQVFDDFANIIARLFDLEQDMIAPVMLANCHDSHLNEGMILVQRDDEGTTAKAIVRSNPLFDEVVNFYSQ